MEKKFPYTPPEVEIIKFAATDIVTLSVIDPKDPNYDGGGIDG